MIDNNTPAVAESVAAQADSGSRRARHPEWCHIGRCTATPACAMGEAHRSEPVSVTVAGVYPVTVTMSLYRANAPWLTEVFVDVEVSGLVDDWREVGGSARVPAHQAAEVGRVLVELAGRGCADQDREVAEVLAGLPVEPRR
jgi:hypothetical protein